MNKSNKFKIHYKFIYGGKNNYNWIISIKKLKLTLGYFKNADYNSVNKSFCFCKTYKLMCNFLIEPELVSMLINNDNLNSNLAFEILNHRLSERTKQNSKRSTEFMVQK